MQLRKPDVVDAALALLDAEGLDALTMRRLAARLGVQAGALYWHFPNKQALLDALAERLVEGVGAPLEPGPWEDQVGVLARRLRTALLRHRDGARVVTGTFVAEPNTLMAGRSFIEVLHAAGMSPGPAGWATFTIAHFVFGHSIEEQAQRQLAEGEWERRSALLEHEQPPHVVGAMRALQTSSAEQRFAYGLGLIVDGIRAQVTVTAPG